MKKKNRYIGLIVVFLVIANLNGQNRQIIEGVVKCDSINLQIINVLNKTSENGTTTNRNGQFQLAVKEGDSILFSSLVYVNRTIIINHRHLDSKQLNVYLEPDFNQLEAVYIDPKLNIDYEDILIGGVVMDRDEISKKSPTKLSKHKNRVQNNFGINFMQLFANITKKGRIARKKRKLEQQKKEHRIKNFPEELINIYGNNFFNDYLDIVDNDIYRFLDYCQAQGLSNYLDSSEFLLKDFLLKMSKTFRRSNE